MKTPTPRTEPTTSLLLDSAAFLAFSRREGSLSLACLGERGIGNVQEIESNHKTQIEN